MYYKSENNMIILEPYFAWQKILVEQTADFLFPSLFSLAVCIKGLSVAFH